MSQTISLGIVGPSYWAYTAFVMTDSLASVTETGEIERQAIPRGVLRDAKRFFDLILQSLNGGPSERIPASNNAYLIARDVIKRTADPTPQTGDEIRKTILRYASFVNKLDEPRKLPASDVRTATELVHFFTGLHEQGSTERYIAGVHMEQPFLPTEPL